MVTAARAARATRRSRWMGRGRTRRTKAERSFVRAKSQWIAFMPCLLSAGSRGLPGMSGMDSRRCGQAPFFARNARTVRTSGQIRLVLSESVRHAVSEPGDGAKDEQQQAADLGHGHGAAS